MIANLILDHRRTRQALALLLFFGTLLCIFPVEHPFARFWASNSVFVAIGYLALGLIFFLINRRRLMYVCMGCSAAICLYYLEFAPGQSSGNSHQLEMNSAPDSLEAINPPKHEH